MPVTTERLTLRLFTAEDYSMLRRLDSEPAVLRYRSRSYISPGHTRQFLERALSSIHQNPRTYFAYAIVRANEPAWLGQCGLTAVPESDPADRRFFLWYSLLPAYWRLGYMTEAVQALIRLALLELDIKIIEAECDPANVASARVIEKTGFTFIGRLPRTDKSGKVWQRLHYELSASGYDPAQWPLALITAPY